jgi:hypothetical protein
MLIAAVCISREGMVLQGSHDLRGGDPLCSLAQPRGSSTHSFSTKASEPSLLY